MNTPTTVLQATVEEFIVNVPAHRRMTLAGISSLVPGWTLDEAERRIREMLDPDVWFVYRGGCHVAIHYRPVDCERVMLVAEVRLPAPEPLVMQWPDDVDYDGVAATDAREYEADAKAAGLDIVTLPDGSRAVREADGTQTPTVAAPQAPQATNAPVVASTPITPGVFLPVFVNQGRRDAYVLAVVGDQYLVEYYMPRGTTALLVFNVNTPSIRYKGRTYPDGGRSVNYRLLNGQWLRAIVDAGQDWVGNSQSGLVPSAANVLADRKKAVR